MALLSTIEIIPRMMMWKRDKIITIRAISPPLCGMLDSRRSKVGDEDEKNINKKIKNIHCTRQSELKLNQKQKLLD